MQSSQDYDSADADASLSVPKQSSSLRKSDIVLLRGRPCKIVEMKTSQPGKHGHSKVHLVGLNIFTKKKYEDICPAGHNMQCPVVKRKEYELILIDDDGFCSLINPLNTNAETKKMKLPENELGKQIGEIYRKMFERGDNSNSSILVTIMEAMGQEGIGAVRRKQKE